MCFMFIKTPSIAVVLVIFVMVSVLAIQLFYKKSFRKYGMILRSAEHENSQVSLEAIHGNREIQVTRGQAAGVSLGLSILFRKITIELGKAKSR